MIRLTPYQPAHLAALSTLQLPPQQEGFTAYPADLIPEAEADPDSLGVTILEGETPVGYFVLSAGAQLDEYLPEPDPAGVAIRALSIDERCQGQGTSTRNTALSGNIALISRGTCSFEEKVANAVASGAKAVMIYNNTAGELGMSLTNTYSIPVVGIYQSDGQAVLNATSKVGGVEVLDADYESYNGTSMATPHVSAAAAVVWAAKPTLTNNQLLTLLTSTATDLGTAGKDNNFGYGLVNPLKAITGQ